MDLDKDFSTLDENGRLVLAPGLISKFGLKPGDRLHVAGDTNGFHVQLTSRLAKLYIEPTNLCNLNCRTCIRNVWSEPFGLMSDAVFERILEGLRALPTPPLVFFGGFGEPLFHPKIIEMISRVKALGSPVEIITNGTLLDPAMAKALILARLDMLWVSLDGSTPQSYADIRLGASLPLVLENVTNFQMELSNIRGPVNYQTYVPGYRTRIGVEFVAMKRNIADFPSVLDQARRWGAEQFIVSNVLAYTEDMRGEALYYGTLGNSGFLHLNMPIMDSNETTREPVSHTNRNGIHLSLPGRNTGPADRCPFILNGAGAFRWDGSFSPCLPLLHSHTSYINNWERHSRHWSIGNVTEKTLSELWHTPEHLAFRERVQRFDFSPCSECGGCELLDKNEEDCFGNKFPTCGACLWAQGVVQCP
jgi:MoaA/NifB/PqqE/SkfB family radical SAM enzyme